MTGRDRIYTSLDEARNILKERRGDLRLREEVENELGDLFWKDFKDEPRGVLWRFLGSPDNGFTFFLQNAAFAGTSPLLFEYLGDTFISLNEEKKGLGRLRVTTNQDIKGTCDIIDFDANQKLQMSDVLTKDGQKLFDFHRNLMNVSGYKLTTHDITSWCHSLGKPVDYYDPYLSHFVTHGVLFEAYLTEGDDAREIAFTNEIVLPALDRIEKRFGARPLIVKLYPDQQTENEDFYWWSYPPHVNQHILDFAQSNDIPVRPSKL